MRIAKNLLLVVAIVSIVALPAYASAAETRVTTVTTVDTVRPGDTIRPGERFYHVFSSDDMAPKAARSREKDAPGSPMPA